MGAMAGVRNRGGIVVVVAHREGVLASVDVLLAMIAGRAQLIGPREDVLAKLRKPSPPTQLRTVGDVGSAKR
jgi:ABC-type protease/lipase transport system fused ATPase/permease subunit